jgi:hypothetical protein
MKGLSLTSISKEWVSAHQTALKRYFVQEQVESSIAPSVRARPRDNVVGVGIGRKFSNGEWTSKPCVRFYVEKKIPREAIPTEHMLPQHIDGLPTDVIETGRFRASATVLDEQLVTRPAKPGCSIGFAFSGTDSEFVMAGTFGAVVEADGKLFILSNNHVLANENALPIGAQIFQPGLLDRGSPATDQIAKLSRFVQLQVGMPNAVDCAIAEVLKDDFVDPTVMRVGRLNSGQPVEAVEGMSVEKTGRETSFTAGTVNDVKATVRIKYDNLGVITFADQILVSGNDGAPFSGDGDSGALIVERQSRRPVGLICGISQSHSLANHIDNVLTQLGVRIVV